jgi:glycosyltransferase involved in cell wall biosynthesis
MRLLFALPGFHRYDRGAEIALLSVARELAAAGDRVTVIGSGPPRPGTPYRYIRVPLIPRERVERLPHLPFLRGETGWEEATWAPGLLARYRPDDFDLTVTCSFPYTNWILRRPTFGRRPAHVFVTQNGDWAPQARNAEYRSFGCDGLVCINPDYYEANRHRWRSVLIGNGMDPNRFHPGPGERDRFGIPHDRRVVLMVSALITSKAVAQGVRATALLPDAYLVVAGDGPEREAVDQLATERLPGRYKRLRVTPDQMPALYRSADTFLHLSQNEAFGNVYVEALACGLPVVAHDSARTRWIVGNDQFLTDANDERAIADALTRALRSGPSERAARVHQAAVFDWTAIAGQYRAFFEKVISARRSA